MLSVHEVTTAYQGAGITAEEDKRARDQAAEQPAQRRLTLPT